VVLMVSVELANVSLIVTVGGLKAQTGGETFSGVTVEHDSVTCPE
jgi:hypothetical protein